MKTNERTKLNLYLVEYYTKKGFINLAWVGAKTPSEAREKVSSHVTASYDEAITTSESAIVTNLATDRAPLMIDVQSYHLN